MEQYSREQRFRNKKCYSHNCQNSFSLCIMLICKWISRKSLSSSFPNIQNDGVSGILSS